MPRGGGKGVLAVPALPEGEARRALLLRYGELVASLGGTFHTAGDMNITPADLDVVAERCPWVYGTTGARRQQRARHGPRRPARHPGERRARLRLSRARGPERARAGCRLGRRRPRPRARAGQARRCSSPTSTRHLRRAWPPRRAARWSRPRTRSRPSATCSRPARRAASSARRSIPAPPLPHRRRLGEQPARRARRTRSGCTRRGILYAPDYVINAGGVLQLLGLEGLGWDEDELERNLAGIGGTLRELFREARRRRHHARRGGGAPRRAQALERPRPGRDVVATRSQS